MKIITWNINGYRGTVKNDLFDQILKLHPDIICLQEIKLNEEIISHNGYYSYYSFALKKGYSGVCVLTKEKPLKIERNIGSFPFDEQGRFLSLEFKKFILINVYVINGSRDLKNLEYKLETLDLLIEKFKKNSNKKVILCGDFNIAHTEKDVYNYKNNYNNIMFTKEERKRIDKLLNAGYLDSFREKSNDNKTFSWWMYMYNARERNIGWRIDYIFLSKVFKSTKYEVEYLRNYMGSDHCPVMITF